MGASPVPSCAAGSPAPAWSVSGTAGTGVEGPGKEGGVTQRSVSLGGTIDGTPMAPRRRPRVRGRSVDGLGQQQADGKALGCPTLGTADPHQIHVPPPYPQRERAHRPANAKRVPVWLCVHLAPRCPAPCGDSRLQNAPHPARPLPRVTHRSGVPASDQAGRCRSTEIHDSHGISLQSIPIDILGNCFEVTEDHPALAAPGEPALRPVAPRAVTALGCQAASPLGT